MIAVVGDALLDRDVTGEVSRLTPDGPAPVLDERTILTRPGGAALAALLIAGDGVEVRFVTALGRDAAGGELAALLAAAGIEVVDLGLAAPTPEKIRLRADGVSLVRWDRGRATDARDVGGWTAAADDAMTGAEAVLVSCYGRGISGRADVREAVAAATRRVPVVWDPHPRGASPVPGVAVVTPNAVEAAALTPDIVGDGLDAIAARAEQLVDRWGVGGVAVTRGADGAVLSRGDGLPAVSPAPRVATGDACGAGDRFAASVTVELAAGRVATDAVSTAVRTAARFVAAGGAAAVDLLADRSHPRIERGARDLDDAVLLAERIHAQGGTVVATGGCFDLLHAGHVQVLEAARALGDCLVVCLNGDASVRRLKGADRPIVPAADRAGLLAALACVDAVVVFEEDTPVETLQQLRPDIFAKGGDYGSSTIPEAAVLASWGGRAVTLPYLDGRSTTRLLQEVRTRDIHD